MNHIGGRRLDRPLGSQGCAHATVKDMATQIGLVKIDGVSIADLAAIGLHPTPTRATGAEVLAGADPAATEIDGGVLIASGVTDMASESETGALTLGTRVVTCGIGAADKTFMVSVYDRNGVVRHVVDTLEERSFEVGEPLSEEEGVPRLNEDTTLRIFRNLTGLSLQDVMDAEFVPLRPDQEYDEVERRSLFRRLFGLYSNKDGYADKTGPPVVTPPRDS